MQINFTEGVGFNQNINQQKQAQKRNAASGSVDKAIDSQVKANYASLIEKASQTAHPNVDAVQNAKNALEAGELDTYEAAKAAAENMFKFGL